MPASSLKLRSGPGMSYKSTEIISKGQRVTVLGASGDWARVRTTTGRNGWVYSKYISPVASTNTASVNDTTVYTNNRTAASVSTSRSGDDTSASSKIVELTERFIGVPYVWGGATPNGFDCSGLVYYVFKNYGYTMKRVASDQATQGTSIGKDELQPGDLVFFDTDGGHNNITHVGIYIGGGRMVHAPSPGKNVRIMDITTGYYANNYMAARRIIQ
jgi:N-acetylmuramoyl-L-alanine amidase